MNAIEPVAHLAQLIADRVVASARVGDDARSCPWGDVGNVLGVHALVRCPVDDHACARATSRDHAGNNHSSEASMKPQLMRRCRPDLHELPGLRRAWAPAGGITIGLR